MNAAVLGKPLLEHISKIVGMLLTDFLSWYCDISQTKELMKKFLDSGWVLS